MTTVTSYTQVVLNKCYGGFSLSEEAISWLKRHNLHLEDSYMYDQLPRNHPLLIQCVLELGSKKASGQCAKLVVETIYTSIEIDSYDGNESVMVYGGVD